MQRAGKATATDLAPANATVIGRLQTPNASYLLLRAAHESEIGEAVLDSVMDSDSHPVVAAVTGRDGATQSLSSPVYELSVRLPHGLPAEKLTTIQWSARSSRRSGPWHAGYRQVLTIVGAASAPVRKSLEAEFGEAMAAWFQLAAHEEPFAAFASGRVARRLAKSSAPLVHPPTQAAPSRAELLELMDFYTGRSAINDSLQVQRGLQLSKRPQPYTETLGALGSDVPDPLLASNANREIPDRPCDGCSAISELIPADALAIEFATLKDLVHLPRIIDRRIGPLLRVAEASGGSNYLVERYREQLAIELDGFAETVGQFAVKSAAVVLSDPYLREGTDICLILEAENHSLLEGVLENHLQRAKRANPDLRTTQEQIDGHRVTLHSTPDGRVRRFELGFDNYQVLSNSRMAMAHVIHAKQGSVPRLSQEADYVRSRARQPAEARQERASLFFGNGFVRKLVGPRSKILETRRLRAKSELLAVDHAALLFGWMEGRRPNSVAELLRSGWLESGDLVHSDGTPITWSQRWGAHSKWGFAHSLLPITDLQIGKVSKDEAAAYQAFRRRYEATMNGMLDPTVLRFERTADDAELRTELSVFPIPIGGKFNSEFRHISELVGDGRIVPGRAAGGLSATIAVGAGSPLRELFDNSMGDLFGKRQLSASFVGDWAKIGLDEGSAVWDLAGNEGLIPTLGNSSNRSHEPFDIDHLVPRLPVWAAVHVRSRLILAATLTALRTRLESSASDQVKWYPDRKYRGIQITRVHVQENGSRDAVQANVFYAVAANVLLISLRRDVLEMRIREIMSGQTPRGVPVSTDSTQLVLDWIPRLQGWLQKTAGAMLDQASADAHDRGCLGRRVLALGLRAPSESQQRDSALRLLGYEPESPQGGELLWREGQCESESYGTSIEPIAPDSQNVRLLLHEVLTNITGLRFTLGVAPHVNAIELRARFQLSHGPSDSHP